MFCGKSHCSVVPASIWIDRTENSPFYEALRLEKSGIEPESANCIAHRKRNRGKRCLDPPGCEKASEEPTRRPSHIGRLILGQMAGLKDDLMQCIITSRSGVAGSNNCLFPNGASLDTGFHAVSSILDAENL